MNGSSTSRAGLDGLYEDAFTALGYDGHFDGAVEGIFRQLIAGKRELSDRQIEVIGLVVDRYCSKNCCMFGHELAADDVSTHLESGYCSYHDYTMSKDD